jgi:nucleotide-binding universal stress UspA family protein
VFTKVLVPMDGLAEHEIAVPVALDIAARADARTELVSVVSAGLETTDTEELEEVASGYGDKVDVRVLTDHDVEQLLVAEARRGDALLCMASAGRSGIGEALLGSVSASLVQRSPHPVVLVGPNSCAALAGTRLAIAVDGTAHAELVIPFAFDLAESLGLEPWLYQVVPPGLQSVADTVETAYVATAARRAAHDGTMNYDVLHGRRPEHALIELSERPEVAMIALATHGARPLERLFTGSVALRLVHRAATPVLVFHPPMAIARPESLTGLRVVVGFDCSPESYSALASAIKEAQERGATLEVVHAWHRMYVVGRNDRIVDIEPYEHKLAQARRTLDDAIDFVSVKAPDLCVVPWLVEDDPAHALVEAAEGADLLVVGKARRNWLDRGLGGSVSNACRRHAPCPVAVVPDATG